MRFPGHVIVAAVMAAALAGASAVLPRATAAEQTCPAGSSPDPRFSVGELYLPAGAPPYSTIVLTRYRLAPGETLPAELDVPIMYVVESGELQYPSQAGAGILGRSACLPDDGHFGPQEFTTNTTRDGFTSVNAGETVVAEHGLEGPLRNGGDLPLVMLEVRVIVPEIDPASGLPIVDPVIAAREENREFRLRKEKCKAQAQAAAKGTPVAIDRQPAAAPAATPAFTTAGWGSDVKREPHKTPRACDEAPGQ